MYIKIQMILPMFDIQCCIVLLLDSDNSLTHQIFELIIIDACNDTPQHGYKGLSFFPKMGHYNTNQKEICILTISV